MYAQTYKILVVGEPGVGKSEYIESFIQKHTDNYDVELNHMNPLFGYEIDKGFIDLTQKKVSPQFMDFMFQYSYMYEKTTKINYIQEYKRVPSIQINEGGCSNLFDYETGELRDVMETNFDKIIVMVDYSCINSMRSAFIWIDKLGLTPKNCIICVSKCDTEVNEINTRFERKAKVLETYSMYPIECISSKTDFNLDFFYKYI